MLCEFEYLQMDCNGSSYVVACVMSQSLIKYEPRHEKTNILVSDLVRHKPGCTALEDG